MIMKITRDGKEIELTPAEIMSAWDEKQLEYDRYDIEVVCRCYELELSDAEKDEALQIYRRTRDNFESWWHYAQAACETVIKKRG